MQQPFFGCLLLQMPIKESEQVPTVATNGEIILYNPAFVKSLTDEELQGTLCHEVLHAALLHCTRLKDRDRFLWNAACDFAINPLLLKSGFKLPKGALYEPAFEDKTAEEIYALLYNKAKEQSLNLCMEDLQESPVSSPEAEARMKQKLVQAKQVAEQAGKLPAGIARLVEELITPKIPWREQLRRYFSSLTPSPDLSWTRPNRRFIARSLYLPGKTKVPKLSTQILVIDTSASISNEQLRVFAAEINAIKEEIGAENTYVLYCDAKIARVDYFDEYTPVIFHPVGGGGTDFVPPFEWVKEQGLQPDVLIYFTDGFGAFPSEQPFYPVLWILTQQNEIPFGDTILLGPIAN
jgi:predicted metal-dependent peptidase